MKKFYRFLVSALLILSFPVLSDEWYVNIVKDLTTGSGSTKFSDPDGFFPENFFKLNSELLFGVYVDPFPGPGGGTPPPQGLYKSDGTAPGTVLIKEFSQGPAEFVQLGSELFFTAAEPDSSSGNELWKTDGTTIGTVQVKDIFPGLDSSDPHNLTALGSGIIFSARDSHGRELWKSDGTEAGTVLVKDINTGAPPFDGGFDEFSPDNFDVANGLAFFKANSGGPPGMWRTDGTEAGTILLRDEFVPLFGNFSTESGGQLLFVADDGVVGTELYKSDGTVAGTELVKDIYPGDHPDFGDPAGSDPFWLTDVDGTLFFAADDGIHGNELWKSDGTTDGTVLVEDYNPGSDPFSGDPASSYPFHLTSFNGNLYFSAQDSSFNGWFLKSDGTVDGIETVAEINVFSIFVDGDLFIRGQDDSESGIFKSDGSPEATEIFAPLPGSVFVENDSLRLVNGEFLFVSEDFSEGLYGRELYRAQPAPAQTINENTWEMAGLVCDPGVNNTIMDLFGDDLPPSEYSGETPSTTDDTWAVFTYAPASGYTLKNLHTGTLSPGEGFWLIYLTETATIDMPEDCAPVAPVFPPQCNTPAGCIEIPLFEPEAGASAGWNLFSLPLPNKVFGGDILVVTDDDGEEGGCDEGCPLPLAVQQNIFHDAVWNYDPPGQPVYKSYSYIDELPAFAGFWGATLPGSIGLNPRLLIKLPVI